MTSPLTFEQWWDEYCIKSKMNPGSISGRKIVAREAWDAARQPAGWVMVPREPTIGMVESGRAALAQQDPNTVSHARVLWIWKDMLAALNAKEGQ